MLNFAASKITQSIERQVAQGAVIGAEGQALVMNLAGGGVQPSAGTANEVFVGFTIAQQINQEYSSAVDDFTAAQVTAGGSALALTFTPVAGTLLVKDQNGAPIANAAVNSGTNVLNPSTLGSATALTAYYRYNLTVTVSRMLQGDAIAGGAAVFTVGSVGCIFEGDVFTTEFDTSVNWDAAGAVVKLGANGIVTTTGSGVAIPNCYIVASPSNQSPYLGLHINS